MNADGIPDWDAVLTTSTPAPQTAADLPVAVWLCVGLGAYGILIAVILIIRQCVTVSRKHSMQLAPRLNLCQSRNMIHKFVEFDFELHALGFS